MSYANLHHVAIVVKDFDWYQSFFENTLEMTIRKTQGTAPFRQLWFHQGIQLNEISDDISGINSHTDHICLAVDNIPETVEKALNSGCSAYSKGNNWFLLPNGVKIELLSA